METHTRLRFDVSKVDHYNRVAKGSSRRVVGILLGEADADGKVVGWKYKKHVDRSKT